MRLAQRWESITIQGLLEVVRGSVEVGMDSALANVEEMMYVFT